MISFWDAFGEIEDPRAPNARYPLMEVLFIALAAMLCGVQTCADMALFARSKEKFLREILALEHGTPSHDTFSRVFRMLDARAFEVAFAVFARAFSDNLSGVVAIDGKALKGAFERGQKTTPLHLVNVWAVEARAAIAQCTAPGRNEVEGALAALRLLDLNGCIVTADALHCRKDTAQAIREAGADYVLRLKKNHPTLYEEAEFQLQGQRGKRGKVVEEQHHDRIERRRASFATVPGLEARCGYPAACGFAKIEMTRQLKSAPEKIETWTQYYIVSTIMTPERLAEVARAHWTIENQLHWVLDVVFNEDAARNRADNGPQNLAILRKVAANILRAETDKGSLNGKMKRAGWDDTYLRKLLGYMR